MAARDGAVLAVAHNEHRPTEYSPYLNGDPRNDFSRGVHIELSTAIHAEAAIVARAARDGQSRWPAPTCTCRRSRAPAAPGWWPRPASGGCYFAGPYAVLDGEDVLRAAGVELIWVDLAGGVSSA